MERERVESGGKLGIRDFDEEWIPWMKEDVTFLGAWSGGWKKSGKVQRTMFNRQGTVEAADLSAVRDPMCQVIDGNYQ